MFIRLEDEPRKPLTKVARRTIIGLSGLFIFIVAGVNWLTAVLFLLTAILAFGAAYDAIARTFGPDRN